MSWLLALHSTGPGLGVAAHRLDGAEPDRLQHFELGRDLSNGLLDCVEAVLPGAAWPDLVRLAVAIGPGGFTATRLTVVLARTLAQQLAVPLDGVGSFQLIARRLALPAPAWLVQELPRRGVVAGLYGPDPGALGGLGEWCAPRLYPDIEAIRTAATPTAPGAPTAEPPLLPACVDVLADVRQLLDLATLAHGHGLPGPWQPVLPVYPTSPVASV
ncbi:MULTISPECIES: tRNA (adenosine(37)-N6)-threonylcarbamoyltransferase complex dimerization subunit type 1 TsaB [Aphanothece]|uniref:tRNA (adenosine(37)-N6)-threonylcarbamoyltransferase complex dimerization subunit type 1 TsaB n=1 Tax=Aphanothece TaxID=1121 RepID=UPI0039848830